MRLIQRLPLLYAFPVLSAFLFPFQWKASSLYSYFPCFPASLPINSVFLQFTPPYNYFRGIIYIVLLNFSSIIYLPFFLVSELFFYFLSSVKRLEIFVLPKGYSILILHTTKVIQFNRILHQNFNLMSGRIYPLILFMICPINYKNVCL